jgi:uncharacterized membrane protein
MRLLRSDLGALAALATACGASVWARSRLPESVATHFGIDGAANGWSSRGVALGLLPAVGLGLWALVRFAGALWPRPIGVAGARVLPLAAALTAGLVAAVHVALLAGATVPGVEPARAVHAALGAFLLGFGLVAPRLPQNPIVGIRTPWTLASPEIWARTHRLGGATFALAGAVVLGASIVAAVPGPIALAAIVVGAIVPAGYSMMLGAGARQG